MSRFRVLVGSVLCGISLNACKVKSPDKSDLRASGAGAFQATKRIYDKFFDHQPTNSELRTLNNLTYDQQVAQILSSKEFDQEGFFRLHRDRLLLQQEGSKEWLNASQEHFCALKLDMADISAADRNGAGYWQILRNNEHWVPVVETSVPVVRNCFLETDVASLKMALKDSSNSPSFYAQDKYSHARFCLHTLKQVNSIAGVPSAPLLPFTEIVDGINAVPPDQERGSLIYHPIGEKILAASLNRTLLSYGPGGNISLPPGNQPLFVQSFGPESGCKYLWIDPNNTSFNLGQQGAFDYRPYAPRLPSSSAAMGDPQDGLIVDRLAGGIPRGTLYVKVNLPDSLVGIHSSPYWLMRHPTTNRNQHLHRAKRIFSAYFCSEINADAANAEGGAPKMNANLDAYFGPDDVHKNGASNCYQCHSLIQPMANFFGALSHGDIPVDFAPKGNMYFSSEGFDRPGGLFDGKRMLPVKGSDRGLMGLANVLSTNPEVERCIVNTAWSSLVSSGHEMTDAERTAAIRAFQNGGKVSFNALLKHLLIESPRSRALFEKGEPAFAQLSQAEELKCDPPSEAATSSAKELLGKSCNGCHDAQDPTFIDRNGKFDEKSYLQKFSSDVGAAQAERHGELWQKLYCSILRDTMPSGGEKFSGKTKTDVLCFLKNSRDNLAKTNSIPAGFLNKLCKGPLEAEKEPHLKGVHP